MELERSFAIKRGQALVEMALVLPILLMVLLLATDILMLGANALIAKHLTASGARAAALSSMPDGVTSCQTKVFRAVGDEPMLLTDWAYTTSGNCSADPLIGIAQAEPVSVTIDLTFNGVWIGVTPLTIISTDYGR